MYTPQPWPDGVQGGCYFHNKADKYGRHNEIHVVMIILYVIPYMSIMFDIFVTANCFSPLDV